MAVPVKSGTSFEPGLAVDLFATRVIGFFPYDVGTDGRFLLPMPSDADAATFQGSMTVFLNWQTQFDR